MEFRSLSVILLLSSLVQTLHAQVYFKPVLTVQPDWPQIFSGEKVTLRCSFPRHSMTDWIFYWYRESTELHHSDENVYIIKHIKVDHSSKYYCYISEKQSQRDSYWSNAVTLTVTERPKASLILVPTGQMFTGEKVTLRCDIQGHTDTEWSYSWYKDGDSNRPVHSSKVRKEYSFSVVESDSGKYTCRGERRSDSQRSEISDAVTLTVSALPRATLTVEPDSPVFTGESVTLKCEIESYSNWRYQWYKGSSRTAVNQSQTNTFTIRSAADQDQDQYWCRGERDSRPSSSLYSIRVNLSVEDAEELGALADFHSRASDGQWDMVTPHSSEVNNHLLSFVYIQRQVVGSAPAHAAPWILAGLARTALPAVRLEVEIEIEADFSAVAGSGDEKPKPELTSSHKGAALIGNPVVLYCKLDQSAGWTFYWSKHTQNPENEIKTETHSYSISSVSVSDGGQYWCRAGRGNPVYHTHYSDALWISIGGVSPPVSLMVSPSRTQHFITDSLSLSCEGQSDSTGWRVRRYTHSEKVSDCSSGWGSVTGSTCSINSLYTSHTGVYWCESESGESSNPVNITVHNGDVILDSPVHPVTEGDPLTLHCLYRFTKPPNLTAEFYKNGSLLQTQTTGEMTIHTVSKSDEGLYHCKHPEKGESPQSWTSVRVSTRSAGLVGVVVGVSFAVLFIILLILLWCYKTKKGNKLNTKQMSEQKQRESGAEDYQSGYSPMQAGDAADESNDVVYSQVMMKNKNFKNKGEDIQEQDSQTESIYSNLHSGKATDVGAGSMDIIYAEVEVKMKKNPKKQHEKTSVNDGIVYSELKQNTDEGP
ncbi:Fc receptor-like protein 5 [Colossoma macropomum]|uniref:Fc receptor-like protein 5 n=1 Tax=Colossoma macropomum TaxID=42526 RepID=UPI0018656599|nr:Fc receptor-like protein 5 [Colossoma macropomum]